MKDLNFFESYLDKRDVKFNKAMIFYSLTLFTILFFIAYGIYNQLQISSLQKTVENLKVIAENTKTLEKVKEIKDKEIEVNTFKEEVKKIKEMDRAIETEDLIDENFLKLITSKMPADLFFTNLSIVNREINISGISKDKWSVAEFGKGLESIDYVEDIFFSNITSQDDHYKFMLSITLKEVSIHDEESIKEKEN